MKRYSERVAICTDDGVTEIGAIEVAVDEGDDVILVTAGDEDDGLVYCPLSVAEVEALIAKLAVAVAYARQA